MKMDHFTGTTDSRFRQCARIREIVFFYEQQVPRERDQDGKDDEAMHYLFWHEGQAAGTARSRKEGDVVKIERFTLLPDMRGEGRGAEAFTLIVEQCRQTWPDSPIHIHAQLYLKNFYETLGFKVQGDVFQDAGIDHIHMVHTAN